jgi:hypothetical protein
MAQITTPRDMFADLTAKPEIIPVDFLPEIPEHNDPLSLLIAAENSGEFIFSEDNGPYSNLY